jgi:hypothetical protein
VDRWDASPLSAPAPAPVTQIVSQQIREHDRKVNKEEQIMLSMLVRTQATVAAISSMKAVLPICYTRKRLQVAI